MAGHALLNQTKEKISVVEVSGNRFNVVVSYHNVGGISGEVVGIKFSDAFNSMESADKKNVNGRALVSAVANRAMQMLSDDIDKLSILGFYLLTDELSERRPRAILLKKKLYNYGASIFHSHLMHRLPMLTQLETTGGLGWILSKDDILENKTYLALADELSKQLSVTQI